MPTKTVHYGRCLGIWNRVEPDMIKHPNPEDDSYALYTGLNIDIDNIGDVSRSSGYSLPVFAGKCHSMWSDKAELRGFFVRNGSLFTFGPTEGEVLLATGLGDGQMSFAEVDENVYFSNGSVIGYIDSDNNVHPIETPEEALKSPIPPAHYLEVYKGSLYGLIDDILWYTDAGKYRQFDPERNIRRVDGTGTMLKATADGLFVGTDKEAIFLQGDDPRSFALSQVSKFGVLPGTVDTVEGTLVTTDGLGTGRFVIWTGVESVCVGGPGGRVVKLSNAHFKLPEGKTQGAAIVRIIDGFCQYITTLK